MYERSDPLVKNSQVSHTSCADVLQPQRERAPDTSFLGSPDLDKLVSFSRRMATLPLPASSPWAVETFLRTICDARHHRQSVSIRGDAKLHLR